MGVLMGFTTPDNEASEYTILFALDIVVSPDPMVNDTGLGIMAGVSPASSGPDNKTPAARARYAKLKRVTL